MEKLGKTHLLMELVSIDNITHEIISRNLTFQTKNVYFHGKFPSLYPHSTTDQHELFCKLQKYTKKPFFLSLISS